MAALCLDSIQYWAAGLADSVCVVLRSSVLIVPSHVKSTGKLRLIDS